MVPWLGLHIDFFSQAFFHWQCNNSIIWQFWDGIIPLRAAKPQVKELKIPYKSGKVHLNFPMNGIAGVVNNYSTMSGEAANGGIIFSPQLLCHEWGN